jgi:hypothetical protein
MSSNVVNSVAYLRTSREFPDDPQKLTLQINKSWVDIASAVNSRTIGLFPVNQPAITGEEWFLAGNQKQQTLRQVYTFGAITAGSELDIPTGITSFTQFSRIYGTVITATPDYRPLPYAAPTATQNIALLVGTVAGSQQIRIVVGSTSPDVASGLVVLEWLSAV